ncbi:M48 family metallopeptidase [Caldithrix abyssi]
MDFQYSVKYSDRKTITITVERDRRVVIKAPRGTPEEKIAAIVESKKLWIYEKLKSAQKYSSKIEYKEFVSGETVLYLGKRYRLEIVNNAEESIRFAGKFIIAAVSGERASEVFKEWYKEQAKQIIPERVQRYASNLGVHYNKVLISDLKYRWGSCTPKNNLNFNWRLIKAPMFVIDYVVVHELAHLLESNHTSRFWTIVETQVPNLKKAQKWLNEYGIVLERSF